ncbi:MAG: DUF937 domain-containing protein [Geobacter sp.]|nr:DUF937 domain-containing protein [Geobacter sp.]
MGLFDELAGKALGMMGGSEDSSSGLMGGIVDMLAPKGSGGLGGLLQSFQEKGLGDKVSSWVGNGENLPISADQIQSVLGNDTIQNIASKFGISGDDISSMLAQYLPGTVDKLTPDGTIPDNS